MDNIFEAQHRRNIKHYQNILSEIMKEADKEIAKRITKYKLSHPTSYKADAFYRLNRKLEKDINSIMKELHDSALSVIIESKTTGWNLAESQINQEVKKYIAGYKLSNKIKTSFLQPTRGALFSFLDRAESGLNLSERIWDLTGTKKAVLEKYLASGITTGRSAAAMARDIKQFELYPDKLFRRVRNSDGVLQLSKSAMAYHPGQGVYRSSYKNALRLTATETNIAYRTAGFERRKDLPFVTGVRIELSSEHPRQDICDAMVGDYPKGFLFTGWHPLCICMVTSATLQQDDFVKYLKTGEINPGQYVNSVPQRALNYIEEHKTAFKRLKSTPYFLRDNFTKDYKIKQSIFLS